MATRWRQAVLTAHVVSSVGWLGTVAGLMALASAGQTSADGRAVRHAGVSTDIVTCHIIVVRASLPRHRCRGLIGGPSAPPPSCVPIELRLTPLRHRLLVLRTRPTDNMAFAPWQTALSKPRSIAFGSSSASMQMQDSRLCS
jgi:hypothetical protein